MKKIFTLAIGIVLTASVFAADHRPSVTISSARSYQIVIDGRSYRSNGSVISLSNLYGGRHSIQVYDMNRSFFGRSKRMIASADFQLSRNDVAISLDRFGHLNIQERKSFDRFDRADRGWGEQDYGSSRQDHKHY